MPTAAARNGDLSAYGVNIYDPLSGATPALRAQFPGNVIPAGRLSPQALAILKLIPLPNRAGDSNGTLNNYVASGSETFNDDTFDVRVDGRVNDRLNLFGRYSFAQASIATGRRRSARVAGRSWCRSAARRRSRTRASRSGSIARSART